MDELVAVVDSSVDARGVVELASRLMRGTETRLKVLHIERAGENESFARTPLLAPLAQYAGPRLHSEILTDPTAADVIEHAQPGLVVIGAETADRLGLARRGFADRRAMILVQGSRVSFAGMVESDLYETAAM